MDRHARPIDARPGDGGGRSSRYADQLAAIGGGNERRVKMPSTRAIANHTDTYHAHSPKKEFGRSDDRPPPPDAIELVSAHRRRICRGTRWRMTFMLGHVTIDLGFQIGHRFAASHQIRNLLAGP
ncbi:MULTISPECIES: hypothetical protein, partial [unclassified Mesorhizobium]|uniref:hypothetical protein n=1 Tax=unclassified Mesorhizobium TaxID=325217 RepID=UPI00333E0AAA